MASAIHLLLSKTAYARLIEGLDRKAPIYDVLVNGIIERDAHGFERVRIFCDEQREKQVYEYLEQSHPHLIGMVDRVVFKDGAAGYKQLLG